MPAYYSYGYYRYGPAYYYDHGYGYYPDVADYYHGRDFYLDAPGYPYAPQGGNSGGSNFPHSGS
jgi:hypothetical protein